MKILIIEDEIELAKSMIQYLSEERYLCEVANTFSEAKDRIENFSYDCILLDISLPDGKGVLNNRLSEFFMTGLTNIGVPNHFIRRINMHGRQAAAQVVVIHRR